MLALFRPHTIHPPMGITNDSIVLMKVSIGNRKRYRRGHAGAKADNRTVIADLACVLWPLVLIKKFTRLFGLSDYSPTQQRD